MKANLFLMGGPKCGTTTVASWLAQHHDIYMSAVKEPNYYNSDEKFLLSYSEKEYVALYEQSGGQHAYRLDASPWYMASVCAVDNILKDDVDAKFIGLLRNPVDMAISLHAQELLSGNESISDFSTAWSLQSDRQNGLKIPRGCYSPRRLQYFDACSLGTQVSKCMSKIKKDNLMFLFLEDLGTREEASWNRILMFLGLDENECLSFESLNARRVWKSSSLRQIAFRYAKLKKMLGVKKSFGLMNRYAFNTVATSKPDVKVIEDLYQSFKLEIELMSTLTGRNLDHWDPLARSNSN